jgi:hypothetical protein
VSEIKVKIIADSKSSVDGKRITTFELEYPRFIHSELMTHRMFSRNAASSRAIPISKMIEQVRTSPAVPCHWGKNQPGMQAKEEITGSELIDVKGEWSFAAQNAAESAEFMANEGVHKQVVNRILEPFQMMKTVLTATEFDNFFWLRNHKDAQPEIKRLAELMLEAMNGSEPIPLLPGEWHLPYYGEHGALFGNFSDKELEDALAISSSCCAQVSYRLLDDSIEKARMVYKRLVESSPVHASPFEHQATPMKYTTCVDQCMSNLNKDPQKLTQLDVEWEGGITHADREGDYWSGNFKSWIQHRQLIPGNVCNNYKENV